MCGNEIKPQTLASPGFISIAMHPAIRSYDKQAFNIMSEESEEKKIIVKKSEARKMKFGHNSEKVFWQKWYFYFLINQLID